MTARSQLISLGANYEYPAGDYAKREQLRKAHEDYTRGFFTS